MGIGDVSPVENCEGLHYVDTGMYGAPEYGAVYILDAERPAVVDTGIGTNYERVLAALSEVGIDPGDLEVIAPTHVHLDHAGGAGFLARECPNAEVCVHEVGAPHLVDPGRLVEGTKRAVGEQWEAFYVEPEPVPEGRVREIADGDELDLGDRALDVHAAPGHAPHQVVFHDPDASVVFTADAAGVWVPAREAVRPTTPPPNFDLEGCLDDIDTIRDLDPEVLCYAHYGPAPTGDRLDAYERVLTEWVREIEEARAQLGDDEAVVEHFVERDDMAPLWGELKAREEAAMNVRGVLLSLDRRGD